MNSSISKIDMNKQYNINTIVKFQDAFRVKKHLPFITAVCLSIGDFGTPASLQQQEANKYALDLFPFVRSL